ncbi:hypothetical protein [Streptomyces sp. CC77]|uniref:deoxynucleotide monophosphate kinase family protein n=1 Tax=Streptomyces sp. CC77 TaxID=1906739 RepID=UPI000B0A5982|nr:hypothetical protein [Streptomyces sp. CC77]
MTKRADYPEFAAWVTEVAAKAGFPVDIPRSGGLQQLAEAIDTAQSSVQRVLAGERVPAVRLWPAWAAALKVEDEEFKRRGIEARRAAKSVRARQAGPRPRRAQRLIGLSGPAGSGKDTAAQALVAAGWQRKAFADKVRDFVYAMNPPAPLIEGVETFSLAVEVDAFGWDEVKTYPGVRELLQRCGTEAGRHVLGPDVWVNALFQDEATWEAPVVVTDVRFPNEAEAIKARGGLLVRIDRPGQPPIGEAGHISEHAVDAWPFDAVIINDGTELQLGCRLLSIASECKS